MFLQQQQQQQQQHQQQQQQQLLQEQQQQQLALHLGGVQHPQQQQLQDTGVAIAVHSAPLPNAEGSEVGDGRRGQKSSAESSMDELLARPPLKSQRQ